MTDPDGGTAPPALPAKPTPPDPPAVPAPPAATATPGKTPADMPEERRARLRIRLTFAAGLALACVSGAMIVYALGFQFLLARTNAIDVAFHGCTTPEGMTGFPESLAVRGVTAVNLPGRLLSANPAQSFTTVDIKPLPVNDDEDVVPDDWLRYCEAIVIRTNLAVDAIKLYHWEGEDGERYVAESFFDDPSGQDHRLDIPKIPHLTSRIELRHLDPLGLAGPATRFLKFAVTARFADKPPVKAGLKRYFLALEAPGDLVAISSAGRAVASIDTSLPEPDVRLLSRRADRPQYFFFDALSGWLRFQHGSGLMTQQALLIGFSTLFGAGISALLESFLALSLLSARRRETTS